MALDSTVNGASSDSYVSVTDADTYMAARLYTTEWDAASTPDKEKSLKMSTVELDRMAWRGTVTTTTQALRWGRSGVFDLDGVEFPSDEIPYWLTQATTELANSLVKEDRYAENDAVGLRKVTAGEVAISWDRRWQNTRNSITVLQMISPYLQYSASANYTLLDRA